MGLRFPAERRRVSGIPIQLKYTMLLTLSGGFTSLVMVFVMAWFIQRNYNLFFGDDLGVSSQVLEMIRREQQLLEATLFTLFVASVLIIFVVSFIVTRRLTGPMVAVQRQLWLFARGEWSRDFHLRKNDEFKELEMLINQVRTQHLSGKKASSS